MKFDVIVIGAGAAGLLGAIRASELGQQVLLLEKNKKLGVKILMSGGTRCNITQNTDSRGIVSAFGEQGAFLHSALSRFSTRDIVDLLKHEGVETKIEPTGKIFPASDRAIDVRDALGKRLKRTNARIITECPVIDIKYHTDSFSVYCHQEVFTARKLLLTTGGQSYPGCGTTGDGYAWARAFGHRIVPPRPALTPLLCELSWVRELSGVTLNDVHCDLELVRSAPHRSRFHRNCSRGSFLFTHFGFSGPAPLNVSREWINSRSKILVCDFLPSVTPGVLENQLHELKQSDGKRTVSAIVLASVPSRLWHACLAQTNIDPTIRCAELSKAQIHAIVKQLKSARVAISGVKGFAKAEVTAGGVSLAEVDSRSLQSKLLPNLFFAGEILDLDGPIGGFNFQAAFSTAWLAATALSDTPQISF